MVESGRIRLPMAIDAKARKDFTFFAVAPARRLDGPQSLLNGCEAVIGNAASGIDAMEQGLSMMVSGDPGPDGMVISSSVQAKGSPAANWTRLWVFSSVIRSASGQRRYRSGTLPGVQPPALKEPLRVGRCRSRRRGWRAAPNGIR
jgi:hypothetical protein